MQWKCFSEHPLTTNESNAWATKAIIYLHLQGEDSPGTQRQKKINKQNKQKKQNKIIK